MDNSCEHLNKCSMDSDMPFISQKMSQKVVFFLVILAAALVTNAKAYHRKQLRVIGGRNVTIDQFPHMVSIRYNNKHFCGGAIISPRHILTAAHCFFLDDEKLSDEILQNITVVTGTHTLSKGGHVYSIKNVTTHEKFKNEAFASWVNDVAVVTLNTTILFGKNVHALDLPNSEVRDNTTATVSGWSVANESDKEGNASDTLQAITIKLVPHEDCRLSLAGKFMDLLEHQICGFLRKGVGICYNDSGSPLVQSGKVIGITSWKIRCAGGWPDVFTNVYRYLDFIRKAMV